MTISASLAWRKLLKGAIRRKGSVCCFLTYTFVCKCPDYKYAGTVLSIAYALRGLIWRTICIFDRALKEVIKYSFQKREQWLRNSLTERPGRPPKGNRKWNIRGVKPAQISRLIKKKKTLLWTGHSCQIINDNMVGKRCECWGQRKTFSTLE